MVGFEFRLREFNATETSVQDKQTLFVPASASEIIDITDEYLKRGE